MRKLLTVMGISDSIGNLTLRGAAISFADAVTAIGTIGVTERDVPVPMKFTVTDGRLAIQLFPSFVPLAAVFNVIPGSVSDGGDDFTIDIDSMDHFPEAFDELAVAYLTSVVDADDTPESDIPVILELIDRLSDIRPVLPADEEEALQNAMNGYVDPSEVKLLSSAMKRADVFEQNKVAARHSFINTMERLRSR